MHKSYFLLSVLGNSKPKGFAVCYFQVVQGIWEEGGVTVSHPSGNQAGDFLSCIAHEFCADVLCSLLCMRDGSKAFGTDRIFPARHRKKQQQKQRNRQRNKRKF